MDNPPRDPETGKSVNASEGSDSRADAYVETAPDSGEGGSAFREYAASLAAKHVREALDVIVQVMRAPRRNARLQLVAADRLLELAGEKREAAAAEALVSVRQPKPRSVIAGDRLEALRQAKKAERRGER